MRISLDGKVALVTGSTSGIGLGMAIALAEAGAHVMLNGLGDPAQIEATRSALAEKTGRTILFDGADMTKPDQIEAMVTRCNGDLGTIDILVNNAGIQHVSKIEEFPVEKWDAIIAINMSSAFHTTRAAVPAMKEKGWGRIINLASAHGLVASPFKSAYVAAKHGVVGMTKVVALETAEFGITCNAVCPGYVKTPLVEKQITDQAKVHGITEDEVVRKIMLDPQPTKEFVTTEQLGAFTVFLCSDGAASITGAALPMDGGWTSR